MQKSYTLDAKRREKVGSKYAQRIRAAGGLPVVVYGHGHEPVALYVDAKETIKHLEKGEKVFGINIEGESGEQTVLLRDLQFDYLGTNIIHADLALVDLNEQVEVSVHVKLVGDAKGLNKPNTVLLHPHTEVEIRCTVATLPDELRLNVADLDVGESLHASDLQLPEGVELLSDEDTVLATIHETREEEETAEAGAAEGEGSMPERIGEKKDEEADKE
ncbi:MAG: 50S ribosomal protein L25 [Phycisphaerales bacterium]